MVKYSTQQAAHELGVCADTVRRWILHGMLPAERGAHGHYVVKAEDLERLEIPDPTYITRIQAGHMLRVKSSSEFVFLERRGYLHPVKLGGRYYYDPEEVRRLGEAGWPRRRMIHRLSPQDYAYQRTEHDRLRIQQRRDERDPKPFPETWVQTREAAKIFKMCRAALLLRARDGRLEAKFWRNTWWFNPNG